MVEGRKQAVSIRMTSTDVHKVKRLASRLGVRDSDVIRFAVKSTLAKLGPLYDAEVQGRNLVPVFVEWGVELLRFFDKMAQQSTSDAQGVQEAPEVLEGQDPPPRPRTPLE